VLGEDAGEARGEARAVVTGDVEEEDFLGRLHGCHYRRAQVRRNRTAAPVADPA
jgi:hypothetical protein